MSTEKAGRLFAKRLRERRKEKGWTQAELATKAGLTASAISQFAGVAAKRHGRSAGAVALVQELLEFAELAVGEGVLPDPVPVVRT